MQSSDSFYDEHRLYSDEYDNDYFNNTYKKYVSSTSYDSDAYSISNCVINVDYDDPYSTTVTDFLGNELVNGTDYTLSVIDDCYIKVTGKGNYSSTYSTRSLSMNNMTAYSEYETSVYNAGENIAPSTWLDSLTLGTDYTVSYPSNCSPGTHYDVIQGIGKYTGAIYKKYEITARDINTTGIALSYTSTAYNGSEQMPDIIFDSDYEDDVDYSFECETSILPGVYTITIYGEGNYSGTAVLSYEIFKGNVGDYDISLSAANYVYDSSEKKPVVTVSSLTSGRDYTLTYSDNTMSGVAYATVSGIGYYEGSVWLEYYIQPKQARVQIDSKIPRPCRSAGVRLTASADIL